MTDEPYELNDEQFASVLRLGAPERYEHFLKRICDTERVYLLAERDNPVVLTGEGPDAAPPQLPLWPHPRYAQAYRDTFGGADFTAVDLEALVEEILPGLAEDGIDVAAFPTPEGMSPVVPAARFRDDILAYHDEWYGGWPK